ncbi:MAG: TonB-dependent receptor [Leeuwenhoekiella sp.]
MKHSFLFIIFLFTVVTVQSQEYKIEGKIVDLMTFEPIPHVAVLVDESEYLKTNAEGLFSINLDLQGNHTLTLQKSGYITKNLPILLQNGQNLKFDAIPLEINVAAEQSDIGIITLEDDALNGDDEQADYNISGLLTASKDVFLNAAAYDFSATFFRPRGLGSENGKILINGIEMNKIFNGRPQWANWGGLNDAQRNQEFTMGISASDYTFGGLAGTTNIVMRASQYRRGGRVSYASSNKTYTGRLMASYNTGLSQKGWAFSTLVSRRYGNEGYINGTLYDANSIFLAVEKKLNNQHSLNLSSFYTPNRRGRSTALTDEVYQLKGSKYNPNWGYLDGEKRNSRMREIKQPVIMLNHYWQINDSTRLNTNVAYQFGTIANTRLDNGGTQLITTDGQESYLGGARNPSPNYYQNLPSYFLRDQNPTAADYQNAYLAEQSFIDDGQLNWNSLYAENNTAGNNGGNSIYALQADVTNDKKLTFNTNYRSKIRKNLDLNATFNFNDLQSANYARIEDLLGGTGYLDIDSFAEDDITTEGNLAQSDLRNRNRLVTEGYRYKYNYNIHALTADGFAQLQLKLKKADIYFGSKLGVATYQRNGLYENGYYPGNRSFGKSEKLNFTSFGVKAGGTYKLSGRHLFDFNSAYFSKAPTIRNTFSNSRQNNDVVNGISSEKITTIDASYIYRSPLINARLTGYFINMANGSDLSFFYTQSAQGVNEGYAFVQEILTNIQRRNLGAELGVEAQITTTFKLKSAIAVGQNTYQNNPNIYFTSDDIEGRLTYGDGTTKLKNYHLASGPETAMQFGFEYRDPEYWFVGTTTNYFANAYVDVSNLRRSDAFTTDSDGLPINAYDDSVGRQLLQQEKLDDYFLVNIIGGKSWRIDDYFVGFFAVINNVLNTDYRTGGFEDSRISDYRGLIEESRRKTPLFGNRYFSGYGPTYYLNFYVRF